MIGQTELFATDAATETDDLVKSFCLFCYKISRETVDGHQLIDNSAEASRFH